MLTIAKVGEAGLVYRLGSQILFELQRLFLNPY